ncbi:MAG: hypothetical protein HY076_08425 [Candidatus Eisenbacteria bacterium]|uniref:Uncharacterized protein n=1 Tax=Eiseniibacteriota bacterium TaxID=2212470 RepID=A0A9D6L5N0_UNCEI|nr:hypothetical protein [Candidatus Eisenbacteria bacterium]MBI3540282.1 hypothetical protein [Candidatus Eisenbacteria bacterium]
MQESFKKLLGSGRFYFFAGVVTGACAVASTMVKLDLPWKIGHAIGALGPIAYLSAFLASWWGAASAGRGLFVAAAMVVGVMLNGLAYLLIAMAIRAWWRPHRWAAVASLVLIALWLGFSVGVPR